MANIMIICPHCESQFRYKLPRQNKMKTLRIRPGPKGGRFEYTATVDQNLLEAGQFTRLDDMVLYPIGASIGSLIGSLAYIAIQFPTTEPLLYLVGIGGCAGLLLTHWWLCDEAVVRGKAMRWFSSLANRWLLVEEDANKPVVLEVSHTERDGGSEQGRTIQYFGELPVEVGPFVEYVRAVMAGESLAIANWTGSGKPFSRQEYQKLLDILRQAGAVLTYPGKGNKLTRKGQRTLESYLHQIDQITPLPRLPERA